jgi:hypothetical protein
VVREHGLRRRIVLCTKDEKFALEVEVRLIAELRTYRYDDRPGLRGTNLTRGGEGVSGLVPSVETRRRMSVSRRGTHWSTQQREKMLGRVPSVESRIKTSLSMRGRPQPPGSGVKISAGKKGKTTSLLGRPKPPEHTAKSAQSRRARKQVCGRCRQMGHKAPTCTENLLVAT